MVNDSDVTQPDPRLEALVGDWLTVPDIVERLGVPLSTVRGYLRDRELVGVRLGERKVLKVPARFLTERGPLSALRGTIIVLADGRMTDAEIIEWLHSADDTLSVGPAPIDALLAGRKAEVRRRAQELAL